MYPYIFPENAKEAEQEKLMLQVLEKHFQSPQGSVNNKTTGDFRVWVYLNNKQGRTFNIAVRLAYFSIQIPLIIIIIFFRLVLRRQHMTYVAK